MPSVAKSSKTEKTERQKLIDNTLRKQRSAEKRRGNLIVGVAVFIALLMIGYASYPSIRDAFKDNQYSGTPIAEIGQSASVCQKVETKEASDVSNHVAEGQKVPYDTAPPAFGPHWNVAGVAPAPFDRKFYDEGDRPALEALVHNLEHGYTILWYDKTIADDADKLSQVRAIAKGFDSDSDNANFRLKFIAAPWLDSDENGTAFPDGQHVAFTHWSGTAEASTGVWQYCSDVSGEALQTYMDDYPYTDAPEAAAT